MWFFILIPCGLLLVWFVTWWYSFFNQFRNQGSPAKKLGRKEIENWKKRGLSGAEAGQAYNNGWTNPADPQIVNGRIKFYVNYQQSDENLNPTKVNRSQLNNCYQILYKISRDNNLKMNYISNINQLEDYLLPYGRKKRDLLSFQNERKWDLIYQKIRKAETVEEVNQQTANINSLDDYYSNYKKTKDDLIRIQNDQH